AELSTERGAANAVRHAHQTSYAFAAAARAAGPSLEGRACDVASEIDRAREMSKRTASLVLSAGCLKNRIASARESHAATPIRWVDPSSALEFAPKRRAPFARGRVAELDASGDARRPHACQAGLAILTRTGSTDRHIVVA